MKGELPCIAYNTVKKEGIIKIFTLKTSSCCESNKCEFILDQEANYNFFNLRIGNF